MGGGHQAERGVEGSRGALQREGPNGAGTRPRPPPNPAPRWTPSSARRALHTRLGGSLSASDAGPRMKRKVQASHSAAQAASVVSRGRRRAARCQPRWPRPPRSRRGEALAGWCSGRAAWWALSMCREGWGSGIGERWRAPEIAIKKAWAVSGVARYWVGVAGSRVSSDCVHPAPYARARPTPPPTQRLPAASPPLPPP
jgi:hypothetical protein